MASELQALPILRIEIPDDLHNRIEAAKPEYLDRKGFVCLILDQALDRVSTLPAYRVGAAGTPEGSAVQASTLQQPSVPSEVVKAVSSKGENLKEPLSLIPKLQKFENLIREFFRLKKGSKSKTAWTHLMTGLTQIQDKYGDNVVQEQLMAAINGRWTGITLRNYEQFGVTQSKPWQKEPEMKHPAHRDFTAERLEAERKEREAEEQHNFLGL